MSEGWRRGWDSNPRALSDKTLSRRPRYDHFGTSPFLALASLSLGDAGLRQPGETCSDSTRRIRRDRSPAFLQRTPESPRGILLRAPRRSPRADGSATGARARAWLTRWR